MTAIYLLVDGGRISALAMAKSRGVLATFATRSEGADQCWLLADMRDYANIVKWWMDGSLRRTVGRLP